MIFSLSQSLTAVRATFVFLFAFGLTIGAFFLFGQGHDNDHDNKNDRNRNGDPNEDAQSKRYGAKAAEGAFVFFIHRGLFFRCLVRFAGVLLCTAAV